MSAPAARLVTSALLTLVAVRDVEAHALAQRYDLPLPLGFFLAGAGAAVAVSFVIWWVGLSFICAFVGNVWVLINPWTALFKLAEWVARPGRKDPSLRVSYPTWLGAWPACALFFLLAWFELVAPGRDVPRNIAVALALYSVFTWTGFACFGREVWCRNVEVFSVVFGLFGRFAPLHLEAGGRYRWSLRLPAAGLLTHTPLDPSMTAFTLLVLGTVTVDGMMETPLWAAIAEGLIGAQNPTSPATSYMVLQTALLVAGPLTLAALYLAAVALMGQMPVTRLAGQFVLSLVPIAIAYHLAHYCSMLAIAGQFIIPLASDPFGYGWDLFGTTLYRIDIGLVDARFVWYLSVAAIVTGHIIAVWIGHATAYATLDADTARRSQYPMLLLMVGYTMLSLWILAQPIVEPTIK